MALRASVEPMLIRERRIVTTRETRTAFRGMFHPGVTCIVDISAPFSEKKGLKEVVSYILQNRGKGNTLVTGKGP